MSQNNCSPSSIYGPFGRYLFLGCSISRFSMSTGWNEQQSELTIELVQACDTELKYYYDQYLNLQSTTEADPGFTYPNIGSPAYFRAGDFEWCGLIQSWTEANNSSGRPIYTVKLVDPRSILEGAQIIIGDYGGPIDEYNLFNVFGFAEYFGGTTCPLSVINGASFGAEAQGFGGSGRNDNGMGAARIIQMLSLLTSSIPMISNMWSYGRLMFKGSNPATSGMGSIRHDLFDPTITFNFENHDGYLSSYFLDLSELTVMPDYYRISGTSTSIMSMISQILNDSGSDGYIELVPVYAFGTIIKIIKVRVVSRQRQPLLGQIASFIGDSFGVSESTKGQELRNEPTSTLLIGGNRQTLFQLEQNTGSAATTIDDYIFPYFGLDVNGNAILAEYDDDGELLIPVSLINLNLQLNNPLGANAVYLHENELLAALIGADSWISYAVGARTGIGALLPIGGIWDARPFLAVFNNLAAGKLFPRDFVPLVGADVGKATEIAKDIEKIYNFVLTYARDYYGKKFMVRVPYTCVSYDSESGLPTFSDEPSEGGWSEISNILGLPHPSALTDFFSLDDARVGPIARFNDSSTIDCTNMDENDYGIVSNTLYVKASVEKQFVFLDATNFISPRVVLTLPQAVLAKQDDADFAKAMRGIVLLFEKLALDPAGVPEKMAEVAKKVGNQVMNMGAEFAAIMPASVAVPLKSNIATYGPWAIRGPAGAVNVEKDEGLVPWEFGSVANMDLAGFAKVEEHVTYMQVGEMGSVTVPGYPTVPLGAEIGSIAGGFYSGGQNLLETRQLLTSDFSETNADGGQSDYSYGRINYGQWTGIYGPNITGITVDVGIGGFTTTYTFRSFTPKYGAFSKQNAERVRSVGLLRLNAQKRARQLALVQVRTASKIAQADRRRAAVLKEHGASPSEILVGQTAPFASSYRRNCVVLHNIEELVSEFPDNTNYRQKAFMSLDGLIRPICTTGYSSSPLPQYTNWGNFSSSPASGVYGNQTLPCLPSINQWNPINVNLAYLNPFANPSTIIDNITSKHGTSDGHDIEILGRGTTPPPSSMAIQIDREAGNPGYATDYRGMALRGPLIITGWGYDTNGKPIPNSADIEAQASGGIFTSSSLTDSFMTDWLRKSHCWPVAPVDLRYDRVRGVWVSPPNNSFLHVTFSGGLSPYSSATALLDSNFAYTNGTGGNVSSPSVTVYDVNGATIPSGGKATVYYEPRTLSGFPEYRLLDWLPVPGTGVSDTYTVVCDIECSGSSLVVWTRDITMSNGLVTDIGVCSTGA